ncbi:hydantoinase/oxoprolinase family protein [Conexibacter sp. DBS9H8]|uniref:hydantoinase/oxoprolinase family protein n=1 Tax=Conexibacter sp. DBS9H8 TaxID=2937801 RepID=UPI00200CD1F8|nr:hydantoinase/oxoprolinase family protein [Conexibacter sp. DBS9H8]
MTLAIGVDVGGTFTDIISINDAGEVRTSKVPTSVADQSAAFMAGLSSLGYDDLSTVDLISHGTTVGTNAVLERKGAVCGLITTRGFRDTMEIGPRTRPHNYGLTGEYVPLIPRHLRVEVDERVNAAGEVVIPLDEDGVRDAARHLLRLGAESVLVMFLHCYANPVHERRAAAVIRELWPTDYVTASHEILAEHREFERLSTAAVSSYVQPAIDKYFSHLVARLAAAGYQKELLIMRSNGGVTTERIASRAPVQTVLSGPAAGVTAAARICSETGHMRCVTADVGGTSFDVALIVDGEAITTSRHELAYNVPVQLPMIDIHTIGAGGGSIARISSQGLLQVGPESAGATPGPVCYGRGGDRATLTDANLLLGRLNPEHLIGMSGAVDVELVEAAMQRDVGQHLGLDAVQSAQAIIRVANDLMAGAVRSVLLSRGHDPRDFGYFAFGGGGALNAVEIARELAIPTVIVPYRLGITSALGTLVAQSRYDYVQTVNRLTAAVEVQEVTAIAERLSVEGLALLHDQGIEPEKIRVRRVLDMQYDGQTHVVEVPFLDGDDWEALETRFEELHEASFAFAAPGAIARKLVNVRCAVIGEGQPVDLELIPRAGRPAADLQGAVTGTRQVAFGESWLDATILRRELIPIGARFGGPAVVEQDDGTTVIDAGCAIEVDRLGNLVIDVTGGGA